MILDSWHKVEKYLVKPEKIPAAVYQEPTLLEKTVRDFLTEDIDRIIVDSESQFKKMKELSARFMSRKMADRINLYKKATPVFDHYNVTSQIQDIFKREVQLPNGGYICIDETEALIAIDVNTGKGRRSGKEQPEAIFETNMEAAEEVARQLRLRNTGGLVVIDFIDMRSQKHREALYRHMRKLVKDGRAKSKVLPVSRLGLMEMTRQREHESLKETVYTSCPYCGGSGKIKSSMTMSVEIQRRLSELLKRRKSTKNFSVRVIINPEILARLKNEDADILMELEEKYGKNLTFRADPHIHHEEFRLADPETGVDY
jgi:ribonuclease G